LNLTAIIIGILEQLRHDGIIDYEQYCKMMKLLRENNDCQVND